jgi:long-chain acyl-CoA synthetase
MENRFKESRFIEQIMVIGDGEKHAAALIQPDFVFLESWCGRKNISFESSDKIINNQRVIDRIQREVDEFNKNFSHYEQIKKFELVPFQWAVDTGELTPTLKLKRKFIKEKFQHLFDKIYRSN